MIFQQRLWRKECSLIHLEDRKNNAYTEPSIGNNKKLVNFSIISWKIFDRWPSFFRIQQLQGKGFVWLGSLRI